MNNLQVLFVGVVLLCLFQMTLSVSFKSQPICYAAPEHPIAVGISRPSSLVSNDLKVSFIQKTSSSSPYTFASFTGGDSNYSLSNAGYTFTCEGSVCSSSFRDFIATANGAVAIGEGGSNNFYVFSRKSGDEGQKKIVKVTLPGASSTAKVAHFAEYNGILYFILQDGDGSAIYKLDLATLEATSESTITAEAVFNDFGSLKSKDFAEHGFHNGFVSMSQSYYKHVDVACLNRNDDNCVRKYSVPDSDEDFDETTIFVFDDKVLLRRDEKYVSYDVSNAVGQNPAVAQVETFLQLQSSCCIADSLRSYVYCMYERDSNYHVSRYPINNLFAEEELETVPCSNKWTSDLMGVSGCEIHIEYDLKNEKGLICGMKKPDETNKKADCFYVTVSDCKKETEMSGDPVFCRLNLDTFEINKLADCMDPKKCINQLIDVHLVKEKIDVNSDRKITIVSDKIIGNKKISNVKCKFWDIDKANTSPVTLSCDDVHCNISCVVPDIVRKGEQRVSLIYGDKELSDKVTLFVADCSSYTSCSECTSNPEDGCGWIYDKAYCKYNPSKTDGVFVDEENKCPRISSMKPSVVPMVSNTNVFLSVSNVRQDAEMKCVFELEGKEFCTSSNAVFDGSKVICSYEKKDVDDKLESVDLTVSLYLLGADVSTDNPITVSSRKLTAQLCSGYKSCGDCSEIKSCAWKTDSTTVYKAGCVLKTSSSGSSECPVLESSVTLVDVDEPVQAFSATLTSNEALPEQGVNCFFGNGVSFPATATKSGKRITYSCDISKIGISPPRKVAFSLVVGDVNSENGVVNLMGPVDAFYIGCSSKTDFSSCIGESEVCGYAYYSNKTKYCTYDHAIEDGGFFSRDPLQKFEFSPAELNADGELVEFRGLCLPFFNEGYNCVLSEGNTTLQKVPFKCWPDNKGASCSLGPSRKGGKIDDVSSVTLSIKKEGKTRDDIIDDIDGLSWDKTMIHCRTSTYDCMACSNSDFQKTIDNKCQWSLMEGKCIVYNPHSNKTMINTVDRCPTLSLPEESVYVGDTRFQVSVSNIDELTNFTLVLIGAKQNYTCNTSVNNSKTLDVECETLPEEETSGLKAILLLDGSVVYTRSSNTMAVVKKPFNVLYIILIAVVAALLIALVIVIIAVCIHRHGGVRPFKFDVNRKPDFEPFRWATDLAGKGHNQHNKEECEQLLELLQNPLVSSAISKATAATEADKYTSAMVYINATNGHAIDFVLKLVEDEVQNIPNETQLFRGNSLASKAFRAYSRMVGLEYLWNTLARFIHELNHLVESSKAQSGSKSNNVELESVSSTSTTSTEGVSILSTEFEVDPSKLSAGSDEETNSYMLSQRARQLLLCILNSTQYMPPELRFIAYNFAHDVHEKFPGSERIAIGGTFFLRFICPALIAPHSYALLMTPDRKKPVVPSDQLQRQLILLGKVLQNLANGVLFGKKEPFMVRMNQFITKNLESVGQWMDEISSNNPSFRESPTTVPANTLSDSYHFIISHISANLPKIRANLEQAQAPPQLYASLEAHAQADRR